MFLSSCSHLWSHFFGAASTPTGPTVDGGVGGDNGPSSAASERLVEQQTNNDAFSKKKNDEAHSSSSSPSLSSLSTPSSSSRRSRTKTNTPRKRIRKKRTPRQRQHSPQNTGKQPSSTSSFGWTNSFIPLLILLIVCGFCLQCVGASTSCGAVAVAATVVGTTGLSSTTSIGKRRSENDSSSQNKKRARTDINTDDTDVHPAITILRKCGATNAMLLNAIKLLTTETDNPIKLVMISLLTLLGNEMLGWDDFRKEFISLKEKLHSAFMSMSGDQYNGRLNFGDCLSPKTVLLIIKHYAPLSCCGKVCEGVYNLIWRGNVCIAQFLKVLPRSLHKEAGGGDWTDAHTEEVGSRVRFIDRLILVPKEKKTVEKEFEECAQVHEVTTLDLELITFIFYAMHVKFNQLVNGKESLLAVICASATTYLCWFDNCVQFVNDMVRFGANLPHGQVVASRTLKNVKLYPKERLVEISAQLLWAYSFVANNSTHFRVPESTSRIAQRFAGNLTDDEMKALLETLIEACRKGGRKGGRTAGKMRTEAADLVWQLREDGVCETKEEANDLLRLFHSPKYASLWNGSVKGGEKSGKMAAEAAKLRYQHEQATGKSMTDKEYNELIRSKLSPKHQTLYEGKVEGGEKSGKMAAEAAKLRYQHEQATGKSMTDKEYNELIRSKLSPKHQTLYEGKVEGGEKSGKMAAEAAKLRCQHEQATGKIMTGKEYNELIESKLSPKHQTSYEGRVKAGEKSGKMGRDVTLLLNQHEQATGKFITLKEAYELIESKLSLAHRQMYEKMMGRASLPMPPKALNNGPWSNAEKQQCVAGCMILNSITDLVGISSFIPTRDNAQVGRYLSNMKRSRKDEYQDLQEQVKAFQASKNTKSLSVAPTGGNGELRQIERRMLITFNLCERLGVKIAKRGSSCKVTTSTPEGSKLQKDDTILYVGDGREGGIFFSKFEGEVNDWAKRFDPSKRRIVLVSRYYDWPLLPAATGDGADAMSASAIEEVAVDYYDKVSVNNFYQVQNDKSTRKIPLGPLKLLDTDAEKHSFCLKWRNCASITEQKALQESYQAAGQAKKKAAKEAKCKPWHKR